jgi:protein-S-isoprenylcysteine O-methyltransferase Ste14
MVLWLRSVFYMLLLPGTVVAWIPIWLSTFDGGRVELGAARWIGLPLMLAGAAGLLWCIWDFAQRGRGTLAPVDPPQIVVHTGLYRVVRNPMYLAVVTTIVGEALLAESWWLFGWAIVVAATVHVFVVGYEEPTLRREFGATYDSYCQSVPRWLPRPVRRSG